MSWSIVERCKLYMQHRWKYPVGKNSRNSGHLRIIRAATANRRRTCEFLRIFRNSSQCAVGSPSQIRIIFRKKFLGVRKKCAVFSPSVRRRKCEVFFADEKNYSQLRSIRICVALRRRIAGANENYFSQKIFRFSKKNTSKTRRI